MVHIDAITQKWIRNRSDEIAAAKGYFFHEPSAQRVIDFSEKLCGVTPSHWQRDTLMRLYGWRRPDGKRRFRKALISCGKKNGKTYIVSVCTLYGLLADGQETPQVVVGANTRKQAGNIFDDVSAFIRHSGMLKKLCRITPSTKSVFVPRTWGTFTTLAGDALNNDGVRATTCIYDEYGNAKNGKLFGVLNPSVDNHDDGLFIVITTASESLQTPYGEYSVYCKRIRDGNLTDDSELSYFVQVYEPDENDDPHEESTWLKANPGLADGIILADAFKAAYLAAKDSPIAWADFCQKRLNMFVSTDGEVWLDQLAWGQCVDPLITPESLWGRECWAGVDIATKTDICSLVLLFKLDDGRVAILLYQWLPAAKIKEKERRSKLPFWSWATQGKANLTLVEGDVMTSDIVRNRLNELAKFYQIKEVAVDAWEANDFQQDLIADGFDVVPFSQKIGSMSAPSKRFEELILTRKLVHPNDALMNAMVGACIVLTDSSGNVKPDKRRSTQKIDSLIAAIMALGRAMQAEKPFDSSLSLVA